MLKTSISNISRIVGNRKNRFPVLPRYEKTIKSKFINSNNRKYLEPSLESLVENISLIIQNPRKYGNKKSIKFIRDNFSWKKTVEKIYNIFDKNL